MSRAGFAEQRSEESSQILGEDGERLFRRLWQPEGGSLLAVASVSDHPSPSFLDRLNHELSLRDELDSAWAARPTRIVRDGGVTALLLEDPGGEPLERLLGAQLPPETFLPLAVGIAVALGRLHKRGIVHKDIKPANILVNCSDGQARLTSFGLASRFHRERQAPDPPESIAGTFAYMAPEQTGRMNRSIDSRSDLYAFGVTLYQMITGTLPFTASEPMEWVHCHIARKPQAPVDRLPGVPLALSQIVMKLLAKTGEDRYQTALGVERDLRRCLDDWKARGRIDLFAIGQQDAPDRLLIPEKLYGRHAEVDALLSSFERMVTSGRPEIVLVSGYSGIGKSSVVYELHKVMGAANGLFATGKFDQHKKGLPYATLAQAFRSLVRQLLSKPEARLSGWRDALKEAVGQNGQLIVNLIPELTLIIGDQPPVAELSPQDAQSRFKIVFRRFMGVFTSKRRPLALFLDDLQWMEPETLELLDDLLVHPDITNLLLVGAYRDNEVGPGHPLIRAIAAVRETGRHVEDIKLEPLSVEHVEELIADALGVGRDHVRPLAEMVFEGTGGNPFFAIHFITELVDEGLLAFDAESACWVWDLRRIHAKGFTDNVADLMAAKLARLPHATQNALELLSCLGSVGQASTLTLLNDRRGPGIHTALWPAVRADVVVLQDGAYRFLHDRIQEAAYARVDIADRASTHLRIGRMLAERTASEHLEANIFDIVDQFLRGAELIDQPEERGQVAALHLIAARRAKAGTAYVSALRYASAGRALLSDDAWDQHYRLTFDLGLTIGECEFLTGDFESAERCFALLSARARDHVDLASVARPFLDLCVTMGDMDRAIDVGFQYMRQVDPHWPETVTAEGARRDYDRLMERLGRRPLTDLLGLPPMKDAAQRATMNVLTALSAPALFGGEALRQMIICRMVAMCLDHGNSDGAPLAYVLLGSIQGMFFNDYEHGRQLAKIGLELVEQPGFSRFRARVYLGYGVHVSNWTEPLDVARSYLRQALGAAQEIGDVSFAAFSCVDMNTNLLASGMPLGDLAREAETNRQIVKSLRFDAIRRGISQQLAVIRMLHGEVPIMRSFSEAALEADRFERLGNGDQPGAVEEGHRSLHAIGAIRELQVRCFMRDYARGLAAVERNPPLWSVPTQFERADYQFFEGICHAALSGTTSGDERLRHLSALARHHAQLALWADSCPGTFENRAALLGAEIARIEGRDLEAQQLYEQAIRSAGAQGFVQNAGLAYELASAFYAARGYQQFAQLYLRHARYCYVRWGADGKVRQLDALHPFLKDDERAQGQTATIGAPVEHLDLATVIKVSQAVSGEIILDRLLDTLMRTAIEQAGAERGVLIVAQGSGQQIVVEATTRGDAVIVQLLDEPVSDSALPTSILNFVLRTTESVVLDDASLPNPYSTDSYIRKGQARSILCLPLLNQAKMIGMLYLENSLARGVFAPARIPVLKMLASQAAISLENTRLYRDLAEREAKIRRLVDANIIGIYIWDASNRIIEANDAFLDIVDYSRDDLAAGIMARSDLTPPEWRDRDAALLEEQKTRGRLQPFENEYFRKDGTRVPVLVGVASLDESGEQGVAFVLDLTERKRAEAEARDSERRYRDVQIQLAHANRVATMGQLTASIGHEVSQPIAAINVNANAALRWLNRSPPDLFEVQQALNSVAKDCSRASDVINRMHALFQKVPQAQASVNLNEVIGEIIELTRGEAGKNDVLVRRHFAADLPLISGDRVQLQQVALNLIVNAIEAMHDVDGDRELNISTEIDTSDAVLVTVRDTGPGLGAAKLDNVFEAFYTTKSSGLGMGLSICRTIIEVHGGRIWVTANYPRGAIFRFTLPSGTVS